MHMFFSYFEFDLSTNVFVETISILNNLFELQIITHIKIIAIKQMFKNFNSFHIIIKTTYA